MCLPWVKTTTISIIAILLPSLIDVSDHHSIHYSIPAFQSTIPFHWIQAPAAVGIACLFEEEIDFKWLQIARLQAITPGNNDVLSLQPSSEQMLTMHHRVDSDCHYCIPNICKLFHVKKAVLAQDQLIGIDSLPKLCRILYPVRIAPSSTTK